MVFFREKKVREVHVEDLLKDLRELQKTEDIIYGHHANGDSQGVFTVAGQRNDIIVRLNQEITVIERDEKSLESHEKSDFIQDLIKKYRDLIVIVSNQVNELEKSRNLIVSDKRRRVLDGNKVVEGESEFTTKLKELNEVLRNQAGVVLSIDAELEKEIEQHKGDLGDNRSQNVEKRFILGRDKNGVETIFDRDSKLTWTRKISEKSMAWDQALEYAKTLGSGWKVPTRDQLKTLKGQKECPVEKDLSSYGFIINSSQYILWTSEEYNTKGAWLVYLSSGNDGTDGKGSDGYVVCVR